MISQMDEIATVTKAFERDKLRVWDNYDYSDPKSNIIGTFQEGEQVVVLWRLHPGVLVRRADGTEGWIIEWSLFPYISTPWIPIDFE